MFPNLFPEDVPTGFTPAELVYRNGKWYEIKGDSIWTASGLYNFVRLDGRFYICKANKRIHGCGHLDIANGRPVEFAGEIQFSGRKNRGVLRFWNNESGHYKPPASAAGECGLPIEAFRPCQE